MTTKAHQKLTPTDVADRLRDDILAGRLKPGQRLTEAELSKRFGVGRGRVREAIQQLARQGLLTLRVNCGATVAADAPEPVRGLIVTIRRTLEQFALGLVFDGLDAAAFGRWEAILAEMRDACEKKDFAAVATADVAFHRAIVERTGQPDLMVLWETIVGRVHSHFLHVQWRQPRAMDIYDEHAGLLAAFRGGDKDAAVRLLGEKID